MFVPGGLGYYETGTYALGRVLGLFVSRGVPPPAQPGKLVIVPQGTRPGKEGGTPKKVKFSYRNSSKFLKVFTF